MIDLLVIGFDEVDVRRKIIQSPKKEWSSPEVYGDGSITNPIR
jgi:hypothetical protein